MSININYMVFLTLLTNSLFCKTQIARYHTRKSNENWRIYVCDVFLGILVAMETVYFNRYQSNGISDPLNQFPILENPKTKVSHMAIQ